MKSIADILGEAQILLGLAYDLQDSFEEYLNTGSLTHSLKGMCGGSSLAQGLLRCYFVTLTIEKA